MTSPEKNFFRILPIILLLKFKLQDSALSHKWQTIDNSLNVLTVKKIEDLVKERISYKI